MSSEAPSWPGARAGQSGVRMGQAWSNRWAKIPRAWWRGGVANKLAERWTLPDVVEQKT